MNENIKNTIFPLGEKLSNENFIGDAWCAVLVGYDEFNCPAYNVTFSKGARNSWHIHAGGQILLVTSGQGWYQENGKSARLLSAGDIVKIPPNVKHWHGATADSDFSHIAITTNPQAGEVEWLEPVSDDEYRKVNNQ